MLMLRVLFTGIVSLTHVVLMAQAIDTSLLKELDDVVITATRSERRLGNVAIPTQVITARMIKATGSLRLQDVLQEQTGLSIVNSPLGISLSGYPNLFGAGIQMQGLDPAYTTILIDGEPLVGRNAGILKLGRIATGNIRQIEIVKGPSSSLYGADAMAGVINIITENTIHEQAAFQYQQASHGTWGVSGNYANRFNKTKTTLRLFANHYATAGYDLDNTIYGKTADPYADNSVALKVTQYISAAASLTATARLFGEQQQNNYLVAVQNAPVIVTGVTKEKDYGINIEFKQQLKGAVTLTVRSYFNSYSNNSAIYVQKDHSPYDALRFLQRVAKPEIQVEKNSDHSRFTAGLGVLKEVVDASRYDTKHNFTTMYAFTQEEWKARNGFTWIGGARVDKRNDFNWRVSPKIALSKKIGEKLFLTASAGMGYRTPDVRQSYAFFTNSSVGYTLLGTNILHTGLEQLKKDGQINMAAGSGTYKDAALKAETSTGINIGARVMPETKLMFNVNIFRNDLKNLIDRFTLPFQKNNGQSIYSYVNVNKVYTQGAAADLSWQCSSRFLLSGGYQYLVAKDKDVLNGIKRFKYLKRDPVSYITDTVRLTDYGGLLYRSKHTANIKFMYSDETSGTTAWLRVIYTGRYGYTDNNGSGILDDPGEYANGFLLCNLTTGKRLCKFAALQAGIDNIFNYRKPVLMPNQPGRTFFINIDFNFDQHSTNKK